MRETIVHGQGAAEISSGTSLRYVSIEIEQQRSQRALSERSPTIKKGVPRNAVPSVILNLGSRGPPARAFRRFRLGAHTSP